MDGRRSVVVGGRVGVDRLPGVERCVTRCCSRSSLLVSLRERLRSGQDTDAIVGSCYNSSGGAYVGDTGTAFCRSLVEADDAAELPTIGWEAVILDYDHVSNL